MKKCLLLLGVLYQCCILAQPTVSTDIIPQPGDSLHYVWAAAADPMDALSGANQTWDFSGLTPHPTHPDYYFKFTTPEEAPHSDRYPMATIAAANPDENYVYYILNGQSLELTGAVAQVEGLGTAYSDYENNENEVVFPIAFGNTWSDDFDGTNTASIFTTGFNGSISVNIDGYGTLILPNGTFTNVLRSREERLLMIDGAGPMNSTLWRFVSSDHLLWLLSIEVFENGGESQVFYASNPDIINSSKDLKRLSTVNSFPNPVKPGGYLFLDGIDGELNRIQLIDLNGKVLLEIQKLVDDNIIIPENINPGIYVLTITNKLGTVSRKITIQ